MQNVLRICHVAYLITAAITKSGIGTSKHDTDTFLQMSTIAATAATFWEPL